MVKPRRITTRRRILLPLPSHTPAQSSSNSKFLRVNYQSHYLPLIRFHALQFERGSDPLMKSLGIGVDETLTWIREIEPDGQL